MIVDHFSVNSAHSLVTDNFWYRGISIEQCSQVVIQEHTSGVERGADAPEIVPVGIERGQFLRRACVQLAPVRAALVAFEDLFDVGKIGLIGHTPVHMHGDVGRFALVGWTEPDIIAMHKAALEREVHRELVLLNTLLYLGNHGWGVFRRDVVLHLLKTHHARR